VLTGQRAAADQKALLDLAHEQLTAFKAAEEEANQNAQVGSTYDACLLPPKILCLLTPRTCPPKSCVS